MTWLFATLIVLALGGVAVAAAGRIGTMPEVYDDRPDSRVPAGELNGGDLRRVRFSLGVRGYRMSEVDTLISRLADQLDAADSRDPAPQDASDVTPPAGEHGDHGSD